LNTLSSIPLLHKILTFIPGFTNMEHLRRQANVPYPLGVFILLSLTLGFAAYAGASIYLQQSLLTIVAVPLAAFLPWGYLIRIRRIRMERFRKQLPEALDLIARSLLAGHAFVAGLKLTSDQFDDPVGTEFANVIDEINFGIRVDEALKHLVHRIDCPEIRFFVLAVIMQRETGGNLAEIMASNAHLIRERFKFHNNVKILTAEGKLSAAFLVLVPFIFAFLMYLLNPSYITLLFTEHIGKIMLSVTGFMMIIGVITIKKLINIQV
jgi:tight adherence protein B